jgi:hypothetical protein
MRVEATSAWPNQPLAKPQLASLLVAQLSLAKLPKIVGQVGNLRPIGNRPTAGPAKLRRLGSQPRPHRIHLNIISNSFKFRLITNQPIIALVLPERLPGQSKHPIALTGRESFKRLHHPANLHQWRDQQMNVICHHNVRVEMIMPQLPKADGAHHSGDFRNPKVEGARASGVENVVHSDERLTGSARSRQAAIRRQTTMKPPSDEDWLADGVIVRQPSAPKSSHVETVANPAKILRKVRRPIANRPQVANLPHKAISRYSSQQRQQTWSSQPNAA